MNKAFLKQLSHFLLAIVLGILCIIGLSIPIIFISLPIIESLTYTRFFPGLLYGCFIPQTNDCTGNACDKFDASMYLSTGISSIIAVLILSYKYKEKPSYFKIGLWVIFLLIALSYIYEFASEIRYRMREYCGLHGTFLNAPDPELCECVTGKKYE